MTYSEKTSSPHKKPERGKKEMNKSICVEKSCPFKGGYCRIHVDGALRKVKKARVRSKKMAKTMRKEYVPQVKEMVEAGSKCVIGSPVCTKMAQGFHHKKGREGKELTGNNKVPCCNPCNLWIEKNDAHARAMGWKDSKHKNYKRQPKI